MGVLDGLKKAVGIDVPPDNSQLIAVNQKLVSEMNDLARNLAMLNKDSGDTGLSDQQLARLRAESSGQ